MTNVFSKQVAGVNNVALATQLENLVMLFVRPFDAVRQVQLKARIAFSAVIDVADDGHKTGLVRPGVEDGMKLPIQSAPSGNVFLLAQFADILTQHVVGFLEVLFGKMRYRQLQDFWLEQ